MNELQDKCKASKIHLDVDGSLERSLKQLKEALQQAHHQALEHLESALVDFEESISKPGGYSSLPTRKGKQVPSACSCSLSRSCARS